MPGYLLYGFTAASDLELPELAGSRGPVALTIRRGQVSDASGGGWFDIWPHSNGSSWVRARRTPSGYEVRHGDRAAFGLDRAARVLVYDAPECDPALLRHFLIDQVVPLMLSLDSLVLHASSVIVDGATVACVGPGGAGKSTLALALARAGLAMVSDDGLLLRQEGARVLPTPAYAGVRLWRDSAAALRANGGPAVAGATANKSCYRETAAFADGVPPLAAIHIIDPHPAREVRFERLAGADAVIEIVRQTYRLALDDSAALVAQLDAIIALTRGVPVCRLSFPRALADVAGLAASIAARLSAHPEARA